MKKLLGLVVALLLLVGSFSYAEEFTMRNGIAFGDTMDEVLEKETFAIDEVADYSDEEEEPFPYRVVTEDSTLAGVADSHITYLFDRDKTLREVSYEFRTSSSESLIDSDYAAVNVGLTGKYGEPLGNTNGERYIITGAAFENADLFVAISWLSSMAADIKSYDEWVVDAGNYYVKIEQVEYYNGQLSEKAKYSHEVSYTYFTDEQLNEKLGGKPADLGAVDGDI